VIRLTTPTAGAPRSQFGGNRAQGQGARLRAVNRLLDKYYVAAASAGWESYFGLFADAAVFLGTDVSERWSKAEFQDYAADSSGWEYAARECNIELSADGDSAWFDEILDSASYGTSRCTGVLVRTPSGWKRIHHHLTFSIPNALAGEITDRIKRHSAGRPN